MILTDKAKEDFLKWLKNNYDLLIEDCGGFSYFWNAQTKVSEYALIIEWLDSVGIIVLITCKNENNYGFEVHELKEFIYIEDKDFLNRTEATQKSIEKANKIYNNLNTNENEK